ncbi:glycerophosphodiester phosphodiesterase [Kribbella antibiotica]|uniref:Glycerophosphodiester phosphodiesterase n=1 Tax=Kribbella antibiotica TaxID=190195 RepID=A0A4R4ZLJ5_9ACTN|nr:glycerophosphodiester phosphodiesterase family protein [Kribbella antibiotica]TDD58499.1 glycerophosphodiester phosphodiesterase [Kribbella antibiotica]
MIITGHRGALGIEPENTLRSFRRAIADGCTEIELDLRVSADGELVIIHDATVDRTTNGSGEVAALTLAQLRILDAGQGERIPTWADTVAALAAVRFQAEIKASAAVPLLADSLRADPELAARTLVTSFHPDILLAVRRAFPGVTTGRIFGRTTPDVLALAREAEATWALCGITGLTSAFVAELQAAGLSVTAWPVPDPATLAQAVALGVDGVTTDNPHLLTRSNV